MAKSNSVRKSAKQKRKNAINGAKRHKRNMFVTSIKKYKQMLDDFRKRADVIQKHNENMLGNIQDDVYSRISNIEEE
jgi:hypothetical protein